MRAGKSAMRFDPVHGHLVTAQQVEVAGGCALEGLHAHCIACGLAIEYGRGTPAVIFCEECA
jgi:hypothetical protein